VLYPGAFPQLGGLHQAPSGDLESDPLTGIPAGVVSASYSTFTGADRQADMLRLNLAIPPATSPKALGVLAGDVAGFPNGRRIIDDVVTIELQAIAGATIGLGRTRRTSPTRPLADVK